MNEGRKEERQEEWRRSLSVFNESDNHEQLIYFTMHTCGMLRFDKSSTLVALLAELQLCDVNLLLEEEEVFGSRAE